MNATESALSGTAPSSRPGFRDGLGERVIVPGPAPGERLEVLQLLPDLTRVSSFEFALRERTARLANFQHDAFARVRQVDRVRTPADRLSVVSDHVAGWRLSDVIAAAHEHAVELDVNAALALVSQLVRAVATLHQQARGVAHGAIALERLVVTGGARLVVVEHVLGSALERLDMNRERLWRELRVAAPSATGGVRLDQRADVTAIGVAALALLLGRPIDADEYPRQVGDLVSAVQETRALGDKQPLSKPLRSWLMRALQLDLRSSFQSAIDARSGFDAMMAEERTYAAGSVALESFVALYERTVADTTGEVAPFAASAATPVSPAPAAVSPTSAPAKDTRAVAPQAKTPEADVRYDRAQASTAAAKAPAAEPEFGEPMAAATTAATPIAPTDIEAADVAATAATAPSPVAFGSLFGHADDEESDQPGADEEPHATPARTAPWKNRKVVRMAVAAAALIIVCVGGYLAVGLLKPGKAQPTTGTVNVESQPAGLTVRIDGKPRGTTPLKIALPAGPHKLELETGGDPRVIPITVTAGAEMSQYIEAPATPSTGRLQITSDPPGAIVSVDGVRKGPAPILVSELTVGPHKIALQGPDGAAAQQEVVVEAGVTNSLVVPIPRASGPVSGWLTVSSPVEVEVYEGGKLVGTSASEKLLMTAGRHDVELVNETLGFRGAQSVQVAGGKTATMKVQLPKGVLNVNAVPWAEVFIDGERAGETPLGNVSLTIGPHEIMFRHPQFPEQRHAVTVTTKAAARISVDLRK